jgi:hypothetical protein
VLAFFIMTRALLTVAAIVLSACANQATAKKAESTASAADDNMICHVESQTGSHILERVCERIDDEKPVAAGGPGAPAVQGVPPPNLPGSAKTSGGPVINPEGRGGSVSALN